MNKHCALPSLLKIAIQKNQSPRLIFFLHLKIFKLSIYLWLYQVFTAARRFSLVADGEGYPLVVVCRLLFVVVSPVEDHGLQDAWFSVVLVQRFSCPMAFRIFLDQGLNLCPLHWQADSYPLCHQGSPFFLFFFLFVATPHSLWDLSSQPGIESRSPAVKAPSPYHWTTREFPQGFFIFVSFHIPSNTVTPKVHLCVQCSTNSGKIPLQEFSS